MTAREFAAMDTEDAIFELIAAKGLLESVAMMMEQDYGTLGANAFALQHIADTIDRAAAVIDRENLDGEYKKHFSDRTQQEVYQV